MKKWMIGTGIGLGLFLCIGSVGATLHTVEVLIQEAQTKTQEGDLEGAALRYKQALELDQENIQARKGLADTLIEAQSQAPHSEQSEAVTTILDANAND